MNEITQFIEEMKTLAERMVTATAANRSNLFYKAKAKILEARRLLDERFGGDGYMKEKLTSVEVHLAALAQLDDNCGHDLDQHHVWVLGALSGLELQARQHGRESA